MSEVPVPSSDTTDASPEAANGAAEMDARLPLARILLA
jgi:hypothetical protein